MLSACSEKQDIEMDNLSSDPVFSVTGEIAGQSFNLEAGSDSIYMFTDYQKDGEPIVLKG